MKKMTNRDARYAARKLRELLRLVARHIRVEAQDLLARADLAQREAEHLMEVCRELER